MATLALIISYRADKAKLKDIILNQISKNSELPDFETINDWVYKNQGFAKNGDYFVLKALGPTPIHVLEKGGDCSDKSRLLMAMLDSVNIDSSLVMLYDRTGTNPTHTVVEVRQNGANGIADPVFNLVFPKPEGGYYSLAEMRRNPDILLDRLDKLVESRGKDDKVAFYKKIDESYQFATTINWDKNPWLRGAARFMKWLGLEPKDVRRPHFMDDPKLLLSIAGIGGVGIFLSIAGLTSLLLK